MGGKYKDKEEKGRNKNEMEGMYVWRNVNKNKWMRKKRRKERKNEEKQKIYR